MKKALGTPVLNKEYFCHWCHEYWSLDELVNKWGYDLGDLGDTKPQLNFAPAFPTLSISQIDYLAIEKIIDGWQKVVHPIQILHLDPSVETLYSTNWFDTESASTSLTDEPVWRTEAQKQEAYEIVTRMFLGIPEYEEGCGNHGIDVGLQGYPI